MSVCVVAGGFDSWDMESENPLHEVFRHGSYLHALSSIDFIRSYLWSMEKW